MTCDLRLIIHQNFKTMKNLKYLLFAFFAFAAISCSEEPILKVDEDDDPIVNPPPPPPGGGSGLRGDTLQVTVLKQL
jgi:hypothetical protein